MASAAAPVGDLRRVAGAQARFEIVVSTLDDQRMRLPSQLPSWTVGHLLTHVARNADSHVRRAIAATQGEVVEQYVGGLAGRLAEIDAGAYRSAAELIADVSQSAAELAKVWDEVPDDAWSQPTVDAFGRERPLWRLVGRRWQELEVHLTDLGIGLTYLDWPDEFVTEWLPRLRAELPRRVGTLVPIVPPEVDGRTELAWLYGRIHHPDLPPLPPWS
jgi:maleylpyruvate isomerase